MSFLEDTNNPFYFKDFNTMLTRNELAYLCEYTLDDIFVPDIGIATVDEYKNNKFKDRIDLEQFMDIVSNKVFRQSLIVHNKTYEGIANKQIGPGDINKIHVVANFTKKGNKWQDSCSVMPQDISWLCEVFYKMYPASINLSQILEILPEDKLMVYSAFVRILTNSSDAMILKDEQKNIEYKPGYSRLSVNLTNYVKYFLNHKNNADVAFANKFSVLGKFNTVDYYILLLLDGKNSLEEVAAKALKFIKESNENILDIDGKVLKKDKVAANIMNYVIGTVKIVSMLYLLEEI